MENGKSNEDQSKGLQLLALLESNTESADFMQPVDFRALQIPEYPLIIKRPMDLGTIRKNIKNGKYGSVSEILSHIQLVWDNCKAFNDDSTEIYQMALFLEKQTKKYCQKLKIPFYIVGNKQLRKEEPVVLEDPNRVSFEEKWEFTERVRKFQQSTIEKIVALIKEECPFAIEDEGENRVKIKLDVMDRNTFELVLQCIEDEHSKEEAPYKRFKKNR